GDRRPGNSRRRSPTSNRSPKVKSDRHHRAAIAKFARGLRTNPAECARPRCTLHGTFAQHVAERLDDGSRGLQPTVADGGNPRRGATLEPWQSSVRQASLRDAGSLGGPPWAEAHGYHRSSLCDDTRGTTHDPCKVQ